MVNLEKISELLEKGIENSAIQNEEGKFSVEKWKEEIQQYTEPFLKALTGKLNENNRQRKDFWKEFEFKLSRKQKGKQRRIGSLQDAKSALPEPFAILARENERRFVQAFITIATSPDAAGGKYTEAICWGLSWWGTGEKAVIIHRIFESFNSGSHYKNLIFKNGGIGSSAWLFNYIGREDLLEKGLEKLSEILLNDFHELFSILSRNKGPFEPSDGPGARVKNIEKTHVEKTHVEKALRRIWSRTGQTRISKSDVLEEIEIQRKKGNLHLKSDWRKILEEKLDEWFK